MLVDLLLVDERAIGTGQVDQAKLSFGLDHLGVPPRHLDVVQADGIGGLAADADDGGVQFKAFSLIASLNHEQTRHVAIHPASRAARVRVLEVVIRP